MRDLFDTRGRGRLWLRLRRRLLAFDSWLDTFFYGLMANTGRGLGTYSAWLERFTVRGSRRVIFEGASEAATFGTVGAMLMLALAVPAFDETSHDWRSNQQYSVTFLDRYGNEIGKRGILHNDSVPLEEIPDHMIRATLATEDRRFFDHFGIDVAGTLRAFIANLKANSVVQGGSSISQQLAKNLFLSNERTLERKIKEAFLALWLEVNLSKNEILKLYLDRAYLGGGTFGVDAAAQFYFGKSVREVTLAEAAMIAGLFKAPGRFAPHVDLPAARGRANQVLANMVEADFMTEGQVYAARRNPATPLDRTGVATPDYFLDWAFEEVKRKLDGRAFVVVAKTTIDPDLQQAAETAIESHLRQYGSEMEVGQAGLVTLEMDGAVRTLVGGRDYGESQFNRATSALRQPGSSFKGYVYITALMNGFTPDSVVPDAPINIGGWSPRNYNRSYRGPVSLTTALAHSINTVPVRLAQSVGRETIIEMAANLGVRTPLKVSRPLPLGVSEMTVMDQAAGYGAFANGGYRMEPYGITEIRDLRGETVYRHDRDEPERERAIPADKAEAMNRMLHTVNESGTGQRAKLEDLPTAGKTGTSQGHRDAWYVGYTGNYITAIWMGNDDFQPTRQLVGGRLPAMAWQQFMSYAHNGIDLEPIPGVGGLPFDIQTVATEAGVPGEGAETDAEGRPLTLSRRSATLLKEIDRRLREAPALEAPEPPAGPVTSVRFGGRDIAVLPELGTSAPSGAEAEETEDDTGNADGREADADEPERHSALRRGASAVTA